MNDKFIGISEDVKEDLFISIVMAGAFILLGRWDDIFVIGTPKAGYFASEIATLSFEFQFLIVVLVAPIIEEAFFRFFLFGTVSSLLEQWGVGRRLRIGVTIGVVSAAFAIFHFAAYGAGTLQTAYLGAFLFSVMACLLMLSRDSQLPGTILHVAVNGGIFWGIFVLM